MTSAQFHAQPQNPYTSTYFDAPKTEAPNFCGTTNSSPLVRNSIETFAINANNLANQILTQDAPKTYEGPVIIRSHHYYEPMFWPFYEPRPRVVVINNTPPVQTSKPSSSNKKEKDDAVLVLIGVAAAVVGGAAIYALGSSISAYNDASNELVDTHTFQKRLSDFQHIAEQPDKPLIAEAAQTAFFKERICTRIKNSAVADIALRTGLFASCGVALVGAITSAPAFATAGAVAAIIPTAGMLFKWGFSSTDNANLRDALSLRGSVNTLRLL